MGADLPGCDDDDGLTAEQAGACSDIPEYPSPDPVIAAARVAVGCNEGERVAHLRELARALDEYDAGVRIFNEWIYEVPF